MSADARRRVFKRRFLGPLQCALAAVFAGVLSVGPTQPLAASSPAGCRVVASCILLAGAVLCVRLWRRAIVLDGELVVVRNVVTRWSARAEQLARFTPPAGYGIRRHSGVAVRFKGGQDRYATVFVNTPADNNNAGTAECTELNAWLAAASSGNSTPSLRLRRAPGLSRIGWQVWRAAAVLVTLAFFGLGLPAVIDPSSLT